MKKKKDRQSLKQRLINWLRYRIRLLEVEKQNYEQNPTLMSNIKMANIEIIQNDPLTRHSRAGGNPAGRAPRVADKTAVLSATREIIKLSGFPPARE